VRGRESDAEHQHYSKESGRPNLYKQQIRMYILNVWQNQSCNGEKKIYLKNEGKRKTNNGEGL
jgi:hypothetical protein